MRKFRIGACFAALFVCFGLTADTYYWKTNTATGSGYWVDASYWTDVDGNDVMVAPTTRVDTAHIDAVLGQKQRRYVLNLARRGTTVTYEKGGSHPFVELGTVTSTFMNFLNMVTDSDGGDCVWPAMTTSVADPNGFPGFWKTDSGFGRFVFEATEIAVAPTTINLIATLPKSRQAAVRIDGNAIVMDVFADGALLIVR